MFLLAALEAQTRTALRGDGRTTIPLVTSNNPENDQGGPTWIKLVAAAAADSASGVSPYGGYRQENRLRQIKKALDRLEVTGRVELGARHFADRYESFVLCREHEDGTGRAPYTVPMREHRLPLPPTLWLRGWIHMLTDSELLLYLALRAHLIAHPELSSGPFVLSRSTRDDYGISKDNYESLRELHEFGLIQLLSDEGRSPDGTMRDFKSVGNGHFHRVAVQETGLDADAGQMVLTGLRTLGKAAGVSRAHP
ncbi:hypothetical protein AD006_30180 (plasmid) [Pseudonocardia sp. EC080610-09]|uniref:hypothetical protein n=1 Tax=unclassified Pseudonocardia TaxID=2619320 RepID=UPI000706331C|nr:MULTISPECIES: hypothetical protein [unclassified Pseudonocardia]ALL79506.1 hypothetical protein AD006_30180 [Pseudonocardia sp. EC080610-09]ALL85542.1 hypothetical protein AD017_31070 [Pseudonocardia sp. EC080619-01]